MSFNVLKVKAGIVCVPELVIACNNDPAIITVCEFVRVDNNDQVTFTFAGTGPLPAAENTALDLLVGGFVCPPVEEGGIIVRNDGTLIVEDIQDFDFRGAVAASPVGDSGVIVHIGHTEVRNDTGVVIPKDYPVYAVGYDSVTQETLVAVADASNNTTLPALGILEAGALGIGSSGLVVTTGETDKSDTSTFAVNDVLYVAVGGGLTTIKPTGAANFIQKIGHVQSVSATDGKIFVAGANQPNDIPTIQQNNIWLGNASDVPTPTLFNANALIDVDTTTIAPVIGDLLVWNGTNWVPTTQGGTGFGAYDDVIEFGERKRDLRDKFMASSYNGHTSLDSTALAIGSGEVVHVTISTEQDPVNNWFVQIITNGIKGGLGIFAGGTQIGADLEKPTTLLDILYKNLTGYLFNADDRIQVYIKGGTFGLGIAQEPVVRLFVRYN